MADQNKKVIVRPPTDSELAIINEKHSSEKLSAEEISVFPLMAADMDLVTKYYLRLPPKTLRHFSNELKSEEGVPMVVGHNPFMAPLARSFDSKYDSEAKEVIPKFYMLNGNRTNTHISSDELKNAVNAGIIKAVSWSVGGEVFRECGLDGDNIYFGEKCNHFPGDTYELTEEESKFVKAMEEKYGVKLFEDSSPGAKVKAFYWLVATDKTKLSEISVVYRGASNGKFRVEDVQSELQTLMEPVSYKKNIDKDRFETVFPNIYSCSYVDEEVDVEKTISPSITEFPENETVNNDPNTDDVGNDEDSALTHNNNTSDSEPSWGSVDKTKLPRSAHADRGEANEKSSWKFPHHFVKNGKVGNDGVYESGDMFLHRGGVNAAWAAANGARSGQQASASVKAHIQRHRSALGIKNIFANIKEYFNVQDLERFESIKSAILEFGVNLEDDIAMDHSETPADPSTDTKKPDSSVSTSPKKGGEQDMNKEELEKLQAKVSELETSNSSLKNENAELRSQVKATNDEAEEALTIKRYLEQIGVTDYREISRMKAEKEASEKAVNDLIETKVRKVCIKLGMSQEEENRTIQFCEQAIAHELMYADATDVIQARLEYLCGKLSPGVRKSIHVIDGKSADDLSDEDIGTSIAKKYNKKYNLNKS